MIEKETGKTTTNLNCTTQVFRSVYAGMHLHPMSGAWNSWSPRYRLSALTIHLTRPLWC